VSLWCSRVVTLRLDPHGSGFINRATHLGEGRCHQSRGAHREKVGYPCSDGGNAAIAVMDAYSFIETSPVDSSGFSPWLHTCLFIRFHGAVIA